MPIGGGKKRGGEFLRGGGGGGTWQPRGRGGGSFFVLAGGGRAVSPGHVIFFVFLRSGGQTGGVGISGDSPVPVGKKGGGGVGEKTHTHPPPRPWEVFPTSRGGRGKKKKNTQKKNMYFGGGGTHPPPRGGAQGPRGPGRYRKTPPGGAGEGVRAGPHGQKKNKKKPATPKTGRMAGGGVRTFPPAGPTGGRGDPGPGGGPKLGGPGGRI